MTESQSHPLVSIIIPYYKQPAFVTEAVRSAKSQTYSYIEIIVVDDGSPEPVEPLLRNIEGVRLVRTQNGGVAAARNAGFQRSSGEYLVFLDSDDVLLPGAVEAHLEALLTSPTAGLSFGSIALIDESGRQIRAPHICRPRKNYFLTFLESNPIGCPGAAMIRRDAFVEAGLFDESLRVSEDYDLYLKIARTTPLARHTFCVVEYRQHSASVSRSQEVMLAATMTVLDRIEPALTKSQLKRLRHARRRWQHVCRREHTLAYEAWSLYYSFCAMLSVPPRFYFKLQR